MFRFFHSSSGSRLSRRECLQVGSLGACGLSLPNLLQSQVWGSGQGTSFGKAKSCIVMFLLGGPPQHEMWDPKPTAPLEIRGDLQPIETSVPGTWIGECLPQTAKLMHEVALLRACRTGDNAHSTSGYYMSTGIPHLPLQIEGAKPGAPNDWPCLGGMIRSVRRSAGDIPSAIMLPEVAANDGGKTWPGQDAGFLGRVNDPWVLEGDPSLPGYEVPNLGFAHTDNRERFEGRYSLLQQLEMQVKHIEQGGSLERFNAWQQQAFALLRSSEARKAFDLSEESSKIRERYGLNRFGQSLLLARRLAQAQVPLIQVNWTRIEGALNNGHWDTHTKNSESMRKWLAPVFDQAYSALLEDLLQLGLLNETLVVCTSEFGRSPKINTAGGRDHWGNVFSIALSGAGVKGGYIHGESDRLAAEPKSGTVLPADILATVFHSLGTSPDTLMRDATGRTHPLSRGRVIREILG